MGSTSGALRFTPRAATSMALATASAALLASCGSAPLAELPPAAGPDRSPGPRRSPAGRVVQRATAPSLSTRQATVATFRDGSLVAVLLPHERVLSIRDTATGQERSRAAAGVGPTRVICRPNGPCFVTDTTGDALLVMRVGEGGRDLRIVRRVYVAGAPYAIAYGAERRRLWVTLTARNEVVELGAHGRPHILGRLPTIRQPNAVGVDDATGDVIVRSPTGDEQRIPDPASGDR